MIERLHQRGFSLIELLIVIIVIGVLAGMAMQSMTGLVDDARRVKTEREMKALASAIVGDASVTDGRTRVEFGYVGDVGSFPPNLEALRTNPGGYSTWDGPYLPAGISQDSTGFKTDEWGSPYNYNGLSITSTGSGSILSTEITGSSDDYLLNAVDLTVSDGAGDIPGTSYTDSVEVAVNIPDGSGGRISKIYRPDSTGLVRLDSLPVGRHALTIVYTPTLDSLVRNITVLPRHGSPVSYRFSRAYFAGGGP